MSRTVPGRGSRARSVRATLRVAGAVAATLTAVAGLGAAADPPESLRLTRVGPAEPAAAFSVATPDGGSIRLDDLKGKVVFLNFWATWCEPCLEEMPAMERLSRAYRDRGLVVLALSADREGASVVRPFLKRHNLTFPVGLDADHSVARLYRVWALPSTFILDRTGARRFQAHGARNWDGKDSLAFFDALLKPGS